ncbi:uncharacterized protein LOC119603370 [Lucilia sericata]|uniref:uncharacterized protein LOC119603370 n=1 Tax=Lucilia sericata TaxID=13632 RepID=UPI0018A81946|nr:uncharacterized protein LOC119603370 [Lucilia sericata]
MRYKARAVIDSGSEGSFISERLFNLLQLPYKRTNAQVSGLNNSISASVQKESMFKLGSEYSARVELPVTALVVPHLSEKLPSRNFRPSNFTNLSDLQLADPQFYNSSCIDILIGGDLFPSIMLSGVKHQICDSLMAQETIFGWILTGPISEDSSPTLSNLTSLFCEISLDKEISRFWEVENLPMKNLRSSVDEFCENLFKRTTTRNKEGRYVVRLPFKDGYPENLTLGQSRTSAMAQFFRNESRLIRNPEFKVQYDNVLQEYLQLGHMKQVDPPCNFRFPLHYYLPHHAVLKPDSTTTKVRVVFNASSPSSNGLSLNDILHPGPILQSDLTILILKWRFFKFVFNADIQKMYRQILVDSSHSQYQRILFRENPFDTVQDYELKTVTFGINCAPYLAIRTIHQLADDIEMLYPKGSNILRHFMYVDDVLAGEHTISESIVSRNELILSLQSAGFSLRKWTSNCREILQEIPSEHLLCEDFLEFDDKSTAKTLGIRWNALSDSFYFTAKPFPETQKWTKREVLSQIARLFDTAGWLSPCVILAKILMQRIWIEGTEWDEVLTPDSLSQWNLFQANYTNINNINIPRWVNYSPSAIVEFHGFCDASEKAYAAALYIRIVNGNSISSHLISSKTKVAQVKTLSIPRLELCGAVLLAEMVDSILLKFDINNYSIFCWTDSMIVLSWLAKPACSWLTFVANRVSKITQITSISMWNHVASESNPADLASRGLYPQDLINNELWWYGPHWLRSSHENWKSNSTKDFPEIEMERKSVKTHFSYFNNYEDLLERFSSFPKAMRVIAYVYRFYFNTHSRYRLNFHKDSTVISSSEIKFVRNNLISLRQKVSYPIEYKSLSHKQEIPSSSSIMNLNPFLDSELNRTDWLDLSIS